jgi:hypothetical protein
LEQAEETMEVAVVEATTTEAAVMLVVETTTTTAHLVLQCPFFLLLLCWPQEF